MILAELEVFHSRPIAPTRRVSLGHCHLPVDPPPGFGGLLLGGVVAAFGLDLPDELADDLPVLFDELERTGRVSQPRLRHRLQSDRVGLAPSMHRLIGTGVNQGAQPAVSFVLDTHGTPAQQVLGAAYAAARMPSAVRPVVFDVMRKALMWRGQVGPALIAHLSGRSAGSRFSARAHGDPVAWALDVLGFAIADSESGEPVTPKGREVTKRFRQRVREVHPDHGASEIEAAQRISELTEARRILL